MPAAPWVCSGMEVEERRRGCCMLEWLCRWAVPWLLLLLYGFFLKERV